MLDRSYNILILNLIALVGIGVGLFYGILQPFFINDASKVSYIIAFLMLTNVAMSIYDGFFNKSYKTVKSWIYKTVQFSEQEFVFLGLVGTLIGFTSLVGILRLAVGGSASPDLIGQIIAGFASGMQTAFSPTLVGVVCYLWTRRLLNLMGE